LLTFRVSQNVLPGLYLIPLDSISSLKRGFLTLLWRPFCSSHCDANMSNSCDFMTRSGTQVYGAQDITSKLEARCSWPSDQSCLTRRRQMQSSSRVLPCVEYCGRLKVVARALALPHKANTELVARDARLFSGRTSAISIRFWISWPYLCSSRIDLALARVSHLSGCFTNGYEFGCHSFRWIGQAITALV
jgi:hypothetical protein